MMKKSKNPRIRFKGFTDDWEQRKVGEICSISTGKSNTQDKVDSGKYPFYVRSPIIEHSEKYLYDEEAVLTVGDGVGTGKVFHYVNGKYDLHQRVYRMYNFSDCVDARFFYEWFSKNFYKRVMSMTAKTSVDSVRYDMISEMDMRFPLMSEQIKIADFLFLLEQVITLHQRKLEKLELMKKSLLQKMFPKSGNVNPKIRFKGYTDDWEQRKLDDLFVFLKNNTLSRAQLNLNNGLAINIHYGDILIAYNEYTDLSKEKKQYITNPRIVQQFSSSYLKNGDIVLADTAEDETVGKCTELHGIHDEIVISGLHTIPLRNKEKFASGYLGYYMNSNIYHDQLKPLMQGVKVTSISRGAIKDTYIKFPKTFDEKEKIGLLLNLMNRDITLHQHKCYLLLFITKFILGNSVSSLKLHKGNQIYRYHLLNSQVWNMRMSYQK